MKYSSIILIVLWSVAMACTQPKKKADTVVTDVKNDSLWDKIAVYFTPPKAYENQYGDFRSPLTFYDGRPVKDTADWQARRSEIKQRWHELMGEWPELIRDRELRITDSVRKEGYMQYTVRFRWLPEEENQGYLLVPPGADRKPAVITVFYEPETAIGEGKPHRDFARQLAKRGFVTLSIGTAQASKDGVYSLYYPSMADAQVQPLSMLGYAAANAWHALAGHPAVDSTRIGIMGHSFGGKWAMFASALFDRFACGVWSDPGIVFDETKGAAVNYWEPWYLGYYPPPWEHTWRETGMIEDAKGLYPELVQEGYDLHELHALMAPRPFLVSGGSSDPVERWTALNHTIAVNKLLGYDNRVAMTNRPDHSPNARSNEQAYLFFEYFLKRD
ncbi:dienelactone hydrolase family protein [Sinomicrobium weinanense]|uniref:Prolyl oligopeptidase family serine peptidase n=1 Tax=Sinomicrobium weinanense TaxID=2842200 RepID=A0A926JTT2_9FLAO|nr:prolyl oligopeptidase family serine peptidase [Sinomicrobium weinanense]MBC9797236.1 prolyl oligopeptidase family serine peptidase [Sinomicrobium weinanense]MBU3125551.1 prolyl oligopeptidase family serine peptidase [Sinomicrobium weinanense]